MHLEGFCGDVLDGPSFLEDWIRSASAPRCPSDFDSQTGYSLSQKPLIASVNSSWNIPIFYYENLRRFKREAKDPLVGKGKGVCRITTR